MNSTFQLLHTNAVNLAMVTTSFALEKINLHLSMFMIFSVIVYNFVKVWQVFKERAEKQKIKKD